MPILGVWSPLRRRAAPWDSPWFRAGIVVVPVFVLPWWLHKTERFGDEFQRAYVIEDLGASLTGATASELPITKYARGLGLRRLIAGSGSDLVEASDVSEASDGPGALHAPEPEPEPR